jgi:alpha-beta hydrolase superfamily lysophospholipase
MKMADPHQRRMVKERQVSYRGDMDYFLNSIHGRAEEAVNGGSMGALLALAVVLVLTAASAGVLVVGGWFLVAGA